MAAGRQAGTRRPTPVKFMLPAVLDELRAAGIAPGQISLVPALGVHRAGVAIGTAIYGVKTTLADVVITDSHPMDQELRQGVKALANRKLPLRRAVRLVPGPARVLAFPYGGSTYPIL